MANINRPDAQQLPVQQPGMRRSGDCLASPCAAQSDAVATPTSTAHHGGKRPRSWCGAAQHNIHVLTRRQARLPPSPATTTAENNPGLRSAFDRDSSLRVAAQARVEPAGAIRFGRQCPRRPVSIACVSALVLSIVVPSAWGASICASQSTARGLATTSSTAGTPASFTIEV